MSQKPLLLYDGECHFCRRWILRWSRWTQGQVDYAPFQEKGPEFPKISKQALRSAVQLIEKDGGVFSGAEAVFRTLSYCPRKKWWWEAYQKIPGFACASETLYRLVADHRPFFSFWTQLLWGGNLEPPTYRLSASLLPRLLGLIYLIAFFSLATQILGLVGDTGLLPASQLIQAAKEQLGGPGFWKLPTLCWWSAGDGFLQFLVWGGAAISVMLVAGLLPSPALFLLWAFYLSLVSVGQDFLSFQWDNLLLETGFLALFLQPVCLRQRVTWQFQASPTALFLLKLLLFKLLFASGVVKLASGDEAWRGLTALTHHYETQPLPTWIGYYAHQLPGWFQKLSAAVMFFIELFVPFLIFTPRRPRLFALLCLVGLQILILLTGNYAFFNLLTLLLCLLLVEDATWRRILPSKLIEKLETPATPASKNQVLSALMVPVALWMISLSLIQIARPLLRSASLPPPAQKILLLNAPFRTFNSYGLFAVMTTRRAEIVIEGSADGRNWKAYPFKWKPQDLEARPRFVAPHQPRLDWQMWFAALGNYRQNPWLMNLLVRLLEGSPEVLKLFRGNPFPENPPRYVRALAYEYHFTDLTKKRQDGFWWSRKFLGPYTPTLSLRKDP